MRFAGLCLLAALLGAGCSGSTRHAAAASAAPTTTGCGGPVAPGSATLNLAVDGRDRIVVVHVPGGYRPTTRTALVLNMHGSGSTAAEQQFLTGMDATADREGFIVAYPQGLIPSGRGYDWNIPGLPLYGGASPPVGAANDVTFLTQLVPVLEARFCIDPHRVFATGFSGGGRMASQLACAAPGVFAAVAPVAGLRLPNPCPSPRAVPVIAFHGTDDHVDPFDGHGQAYWTYSVPAAARRWAAHNRCRPQPAEAAGTGFELTHYGGCTGGADVELYTVTGEGHEWPGGLTLPARIVALLGPQSNAVDADDRMWAFFAAHPGP